MFIFIYLKKNQLKFKSSFHYTLLFTLQTLCETKPNSSSAAFKGGDETKKINNPKDNVIIIIYSYHYYIFSHSN